jgi:hypothetical protein
MWPWVASRVVSWADRRLLRLGEIVTLPIFVSHIESDRIT